MELNIKHDKVQHKFYAVIDGKEAALEYSQKNTKTLDYYSTFVPSELRGQKIAEKIVTYALEYAKENNYHIIPSCPYVEIFIARHPQYQMLVVK